MSSITPPDQVEFYTCDRHMWFGTTDAGKADAHKKTNDCNLKTRFGTVKWDK